MRRQLIRPIRAAVAVVALLGFVPLLSSPVAADTVPATFSGTCSLSGLVTLSPPLTITPRETTQTGDFSGTCDGILNGAKVAQVPARLSGSATNVESCALGVMDGDAVLTVGHTNFPVTWHERRVGPDVSVVYIGRTFVGAGATVLGASNPSAALPMALACAGSGITQAAVDERPVITSTGGL